MSVNFFQNFSIDNKRVYANEYRFFERCPMVTLGSGRLIIYST